MIYVLIIDTIDNGVQFSFVDLEAIQKTKYDVLKGVLNVRLIEAFSEPDEYELDYHILVLSNREYLSDTPPEEIVERCFEHVEGWIRENSPDLN